MLLQNCWKILKTFDNVHAYNFEGASSLEASEWMEPHYQGPKLECSCVVLSNDIDHIDFIWLDLEGFRASSFKKLSKNPWKSESNLYRNKFFRI